MLKNAGQVGNLKSSPRVSTPRTVMNIPTNIKRNVKNTMPAFEWFNLIRNCKDIPKMLTFFISSLLLKKCHKIARPKLSNYYNNLNI
ncbi:unnamed protein product [Nezara viridula]|uniref:Uncharacterized protein n=1 Tax=Nezara viridula TaxID=85310 RepID=A0A9P0HAT4_NEZVI|nr:unnamed protein product [Nezara viridula]